MKSLKSMLRRRTGPQVYGALGKLRKTLTHPQKGPARGLDDLARLGEPFASVLSSMYRGEPQRGTDGAMHNLDPKTRISIDEGLYLHRLCVDAKAQRTLEIGCAYGYSTLYFLAALKSFPDAKHFAIDPFQRSQWHGIGAEKASAVRMNGAFQLIEELSVIALPTSISQKLLFDVIFIDGAHRFDDVLVDFTLSAPLCREGGYIVLDDLWMPSILKVRSFIRRNRGDFAEVRGIVKNIAVFKKIGKDERDWRHFNNFD